MPNRVTGREGESNSREGYGYGNDEPMHQIRFVIGDSSRGQDSGFLSTQTGSDDVAARGGGANGEVEPGRAHRNIPNQYPNEGNNDQIDFEACYGCTIIFAVISIALYGIKCLSESTLLGESSDSIPCSGAGGSEGEDL